MARSISSEKVTLFGYFIFIILLGYILLFNEKAWNGSGRLSHIDALFTSVSAVCVTGLITVDTALYSNFGKIVIMLLIQAGGLGIITFTSLYIAVPRGRISLRSVGLIKKNYIDAVEHRAEHIIRNIVITTLCLEAVGTILLFVGFKHIEGPERLFTALFHSISAFCNAGFSLFSRNMEGYHNISIVAYTVSSLVVIGGIGFVVLQDIARRRKTGKLTFHSKVVLAGTGILILGGTLLYLVFEWNNSFQGFTSAGKITAAVFQSITTRTAGFNTIAQEAMSIPSKFITLPLMFTGGGPGSIAGGIKVTTVFIILIALFKGVDRKGELRLWKRKFSNKTISQANMLVSKAIILLFFSTLALTITEYVARPEDTIFLSVVFESFSAFGTVGLSLGLTPKLTILGKCVIIFTMFAGRVGLVSMAMPILRRWKQDVDYPKGEVLVG